MSYGDSSGTSYGDRGISDMLGDLSGAKKHAKHHGGSQEDDGIFGQALGMLQQNQGRIANEDVDEDHMVKSHQSYFGGGGGGGGNATSNGMGAAAAMQALKMFNGGGSSSGGGSSQNEFIGMAMGQASKLFEQQQANGNVAEGESKESAVQQAGEMAMKMYFKSEMGGSSGGLMGMASKFM